MRGAWASEAVLPALTSARSTPDQSMVSMSSTTISPPSHGSVLPADRAEATKRRLPTGKARSASRARMTPPT